MHVDQCAQITVCRRCECIADCVWIMETINHACKSVRVDNSVQEAW